MCSFFSCAALLYREMCFLLVSIVIGPSSFDISSIIILSLRRGLPLRSVLMLVGLCLVARLLFSVFSFLINFPCYKLFHWFCYWLLCSIFFHFYPITFICIFRRNFFFFLFFFFGCICWGGVVSSISTSVVTVIFSLCSVSSVWFDSF